MTPYNAEYALMTEGLRQSRNLEVAIEVANEIELLGIRIKSIHISEYYKFENSVMIVLELTIAEEVSETFLEYLTSLSEYWQLTNKSDPKNHRVLDLRGRKAIYSGVIWASFDLLP